MKALVCYFSRSGENIINREIVNLKEGNTEVVAKKIAAFGKCDLYKIEPTIPYSDDYENCNIRAKKESDTNESCDIKGPKISLKDYDTIYLGFPIWYRSFPTIISKFVRDNDLSGKIIRPFCTNDEGSFGTSEIELKILATGALIKPGLAVHGSKVNCSDDIIKNWINK